MQVQYAGYPMCSAIRRGKGRQSPRTWPLARSPRRPAASLHQQLPQQAPPAGADRDPQRHLPLPAPAHRRGEQVARLEQTISSSKAGLRPESTTARRMFRANGTAVRAASTCRLPCRKLSRRRAIRPRETRRLFTKEVSRTRPANRADRFRRHSRLQPPQHDKPVTARVDRSSGTDHIIVGTQRSVSLPGSMPVNPFAVTPTI